MSRHSFYSPIRAFRYSMCLIWALCSLVGVRGEYGQASPPADGSYSLSVEHFTPAEGLAGSKVISVVQDSTGYLWIGTQEGLHRYDGHEMRLYQHDPEDSTSLSNNTAEVLYVDRQGTLWIGTWNGLNRYDPQTDAFRTYLHDPDDSTSLPGILVLDLQEDSAGRLWIALGGWNGGVYRYDPATDTFVGYGPDQSAPHNLAYVSPNQLYLDRAGDLWVGLGSPWDQNPNDGGLIRYDAEQDHFIHYLHDPADPYSLAHNEIIHVYEDREGVFWVATWGDGLQFLDRETNRFYPAEDNPKGHRWPELRTRSGAGGGIRFLHEDAHGNLWIGNFLGGLDCYNLETGAITHFSQGAAAEQGLTDLAIWSIFEDTQQGLWVSTWNGLNHLRLQPAAFDLIGQSVPGKPQLHDWHPEALLQDAQGQIWAGTWAGLERLDPNGGKSRLFEPGRSVPERGRNSEMVLSLWQQDPRHLLIGTGHHGLVQIDLLTERLRQFTQPDPKRSFPVDAIYQDEAGTIWVGTPQGLFYWEGQSDPTQVPPTQLPGPFPGVRAIVPDQGTKVWLGTPVGLFHLDVQSQEIETVLTGYNVEAILSLGPEALWLGTNGLGLLKCNPLDQTYTKFTQADGLPGSMVFSLSKDSLGRLWIATTQGIAWMEQGNTRIRTFPLSKTPPIHEFYPLATIALTDGKLWFGGNGGILQIDPNLVRDDTVAPRPVIHSLKVFDQVYHALPGEGANQYRFNAGGKSFAHDQNDLTFEFMGLDFTQPEANSFRYRLAPYESEWREVGSQRLAIYPNLPPDRYTFQVQAANPDGVWSHETATMEVVIRAPWWQTLWAFFGYGLLFLLALFALDRLQRRRLLRTERARAHLREVNLRAEAAEAQALQLQELDEAKARLYANTTHEFRTPLTVILGMVDQIRGHSKERDLIRRNSQNLLRLINQMLDLSKLESGKLQLNLVRGDIIPFLEYLTESFFSIARDKDIRLLFYPEVEALVMDYDEAKIQHIVYNLLSNALKFTPEGGKIVLHAALEEAKGQPWLRLKVQDTGIGMAAEDLQRIFDRFYQTDTSATRKGEGTGIGLSLTRELVQLMEGEISVQSQLGQGSTFTVRLPARKTADLPAPKELTSQPSSPQETAEALPATEVAAEKPVLVLIEDNADVATYITGLLQARYHIHVERNGQAGLDRVLEVIPDIVISDVMMPGMDGFEVCERLKQDERSSHIPIILLTARGTQEDRLTGLRGGADAYLTKPFEKEELFIRLEKLRELRQALKARYAGGGAVFQEIVQKKTPGPDEAFLQKLIQAIHKRLDDPQLGVNDLCRAARLSNTQVNRKLKALVGKTPSQFIRLIRLQEAVRLLQSSEQHVSEVAYAVGFSDPSYFSRAFSEEFGYTPSAIRK